MRYIWFMEFQSRGAPHFHIILDMPNPGNGERLEVASHWVETIQPLEWSYCRLSDKEELMVRETARYLNFRDKFWENEKTPGGLARYGIKYATKLAQKEVPEWFRLTGRFWGSSKNFKCPDGVEFSGTESEVREFLLACGRDMSSYDFLPKIVFANNDVTKNLFNKFA